ncbi:MAG: LD-carboxypeptidase [Clostridia bacterium]|nr:LD-carboxypeptidase [Clostridia bacterium]MDO5303426.1 LD-carboxypeptidase [Clostridia bacterium]
MKYVNNLKKGDTVGLICPSSFISEERKAQCIEAVEKLGFKVKCADNLTTDLAGYMAGSGEVRGQWINRMFADDEVKGIFCIRGGDGSSRVMEYLDYDLIKNNPKVFVGYSDVTNLHLALTQNCDMVTFHGPMVSSNMVDSFDEETKESFFQTINAEESFSFKNPEGVPVKVLVEGKAEGALTGGNLSLLSASMGTPYEMDTKGKILFIEEVCEPITKIEKWIYHLRNAGKLEKCKGILLGQFTKIVNDDENYDYLCVIKDAVEGLGIPVMYDVQSGHGSQIMTLPMGAKCKMDTSECSIVFEV